MRYATAATTARFPPARARFSSAGDSDKVHAHSAIVAIPVTAKSFRIAGTCRSAVSRPARNAQHPSTVWPNDWTAAPVATH